MKYFAPVAPVALLQKLEDVGLLGREHLLLAHDILRHPVEYRRLFKNRGMQIILDGGAAEEYEKPLTPFQTMDAARIVDATIVQLPDRLKSYAATLAMIEHFLGRLSRSEILSTAWMGVPQGSSIDAIVQCAERIIDLLGQPPKYWGVPRWITNELGTRAELVTILSNAPFQWEWQGRDQLGLGRNIHLLGMSKHFDDDIACCRMTRVMGIDSANPLVLGQQGLRLIEDYTHLKREDSNYWEQDTLMGTTVNNIVKLRSLIN